MKHFGDSKTLHFPALLVWKGPLLEVPKLGCFKLACLHLLRKRVAIVFAWYRPHFGPLARNGTNRKNTGFGLPQKMGKNSRKMGNNFFLFWGGGPKPIFFLFVPVSVPGKRDRNKRTLFGTLLCCLRTFVCTPLPSFARERINGDLKRVI